jgi:hypothetical protein
MALMKALKEIQDKLAQIQNTIQQPEKAAKPAGWWKAENIIQSKGYRGITLLMALGTSGGFDSIEQWRNACRTNPPSEISRSSFFVLRKELRSLELINDDMRALTPKGKKVVERMTESLLPIIYKKQLTDIIENL